MAGLYTPDPLSLSYNEPDVYARTPAVGAGADLSQLQAIAAAAPGFNPSFRRPESIPGPDIYTNSAGQFYVNGMLFDEDDARSALDSEQLLSQPGRGEPPPGGDWMAIDPQAYGEFLNTIKNPSLKKLARKNFGIGIDQGQMLGGRLMQFAGAEQAGGNVVAAQQEDLRKTGPYNRQFSDIDSGRGAVEWLVANFAQQGPNLIESIALATAGYLGGATVGAPAAALAGLVGKETWKKAVVSALEKKAAGTLVKGSAEEAAANAVIRKAAGIAGAVAANAANNTAMGVSDVYGELRDSGVGADDNGARLSALWRSAPYAALESLPEFALAYRAFNPGLLSRATKGMGIPRAGLEMVKRGAAGTAAYGTMEGLTEAGQESLLIGANDNVDIDSPEGINRLVNSFAAGFGVGGPLGGLANLRGPANLLEPTKNTEPTNPMPPATETPAEPAPYGPNPEPLTLQREMPFDMPPPMVGPPTSLAWPEGLPIGPEPPSPQQGLPFEARGDQMDLFGGPALPNEMPPLGPPALPSAAPVANPAQGALQFAPPAPTGTQFQGAAVPDTAIAQQMTAAQQQQAADAAYAQRAAEQQAQAEQMRNRGFAQSEAQRQLDMVPPTPAPIDQTLSQMPMVSTQPAVPQQGNLFGRGEAPRPSRKERLQRGIAPPAVPEATYEEQVAERDALAAERATLERALGLATAGKDRFAKGLRKRALAARIKVINERLAELPPAQEAGTGQLGLFTSAGNPTVAALKGAGLRQKVRSEPAAVQTKQAPPTGRRVNALTIAKARAAEKAKAAPTRGLKKQAGVAKVESNAVQERSTASVDAREQAGTSQGMGGRVSPPREVAGTPAKLRKGKTQEAPKPDKKGKNVYPILNELRDKYEELSISPDTTKRQVVTFAEKLLKAGILVEKDMDEVRRISADRDMGAEDVLSEVKFFLDRGEEILAEADYQRATNAKKESPPPKPQAAAAVSAAAAAPAPTKAEVSGNELPDVPVEVTMANGKVIRGNSARLLKSLDSRIEKFEALLACLTGK